ncbi:unnamed protein product [Polarella glacialis]|uniref:Enoyl-CoA hydratase n=1 Tax=Polarella glacialis TaxID=89957 RepID=A0A813DPU5_POLGL|nr:unnamed protein product [Polarella glacialis]
MVRVEWRLKLALIMAVNGLAVGGGANIALANFGDMVLCSKEARFMYPFAKLGFTPELGSSMVMPFLIGMAKAKELMMTGNWLSSEEALRLNLVNAVYEAEDLLPQAVAVAAKLAASHPECMRLMKQVMNRPLRQQLDAVLAEENETIKASIRAVGGPMASKL